MKIFILAILIGCFTSSYAQSEKINFALKFELAKHTGQNELFSLFVVGDASQIKREVLSLEGQVVRSTGNIVQVKLPINTISNFSKNTFVHSIPYSFSKGQVLNDTMNIHNNVTPIHNGVSPLLQAYTGKGVVYGIIDTGVDLIHPDFRDTLGNTRIYKVWDQTTGLYCDSASIDDGTCTQVDVDGHGTHVAGISAGNGLGLNKYWGVAPEAKLVVVKNNFNASNWLSTVVDAVDYIFDVADSLNMPCVVNASIGTYFGSHDGTDPAALLINSLIGSQSGRAFVCAAGNAGGFKWHVQQTVTADTSFSWLKYNPTSAFGFGSVYYEVWADTADFNNVDFAFGANLPSGSFEERGRTPFFNIQNRLGSYVDTINNGGDILAIVETYAELQGDKYYLEVMLIEPDSNTYNFSFLSTGVGKFDFWSSSTLRTSDIVSTGLPTIAVYPPIAYYTLPDSNQTIVSSFSSSPDVLTVASFQNRKTYLDYDSVEQVSPNTVGMLADYSSLGPDRRGNVKPDIGATGSTVLSSVSASIIAANLASSPINRGRNAFGGMHRVNSGTSMASPVVAGVAALYLEKCSNASMVEIKSAIINTATQDTFTGPVPNNYFGYGKVDAFSALKLSTNSLMLGVDKDLCGIDSVQVMSPPSISYVWSSGEITQSIIVDTTASVSVTVTNGSNCKSVSDTLNVFWHPLPVKPIIIIKGNDTLVYSTVLNLQWFYNSGHLNGESDTVLLAQSNGDYFVEVSDMFGCSVVSDTVVLTTVGIEKSTLNSFSIYPNPTKGDLILKLNHKEFQSLRLINILGKVLVDREISGHENIIELELSQFTEGVYYLQLNSLEENYLQKLILFR